MSPKFLRQIGLDAMAEEAEARAAQLAIQKAVKRRKLSQAGIKRMLKQTYEIESILEERPSTGRAGAWYRVQWAGYESSWEAWRVEGEVGSPIVTWEPLCKIRGSAVWEECGSASSGRAGRDAGRTKNLSTGLHLSQLGGMYDPRCDSVVIGVCAAPGVVCMRVAVKIDRL